MRNCFLVQTYPRCYAQVLSQLLFSHWCHFYVLIFMLLGGKRAAQIYTYNLNAALSIVNHVGMFANSISLQKFFKIIFMTKRRMKMNFFWVISKPLCSTWWQQPTREWSWLVWWHTTPKRRSPGGMQSKRGSVPS